MPQNFCHRHKWLKLAAVSIFSLLVNEAFSHVHLKRGKSDLFEIQLAVLTLKGTESSFLAELATSQQKRNGRQTVMTAGWMVQLFK